MWIYTVWRENLITLGSHVEFLTRNHIKKLFKCFYLVSKSSVDCKIKMIQVRWTYIDPLAHIIIQTWFCRWPLRSPEIAVDLLPIDLLGQETVNFNIRATEEHTHMHIHTHCFGALERFSLVIGCDYRNAEIQSICIKMFPPFLCEVNICAMQPPTGQKPETDHQHTQKKNRK